VNIAQVRVVFNEKLFVNNDKPDCFRLYSESQQVTIVNSLDVIRPVIIIVNDSRVCLQEAETSLSAVSLSAV